MNLMQYMLRSTEKNQPTRGNQLPLISALTAWPPKRPSLLYKSVAGDLPNVIQSPQVVLESLQGICIPTTKVQQQQTMLAVQTAELAFWLQCNWPMERGLLPVVA